MSTEGILPAVSLSFVFPGTWLPLHVFHHGKQAGEGYRFESHPVTYRDARL